MINTNKKILNVNEMTLKELRKLAGLSQEDTAKLIGVAPRSYQNWELGERRIKHSTESAIREKLRNVLLQLHLKRIVNYRQSDGTNADGYICYLKNCGQDEFQWFIPVIDGKLSEDIINKIICSETEFNLKIQFDIDV